MDMVLLTPDEINRFILNLKMRYGGSSDQQHQKKKSVKTMHA
jgi:hypothetical protein